MKKQLMMVVCLLACVCASAQISTGEPNSSVIPRTGNRPQAGDWGLYLGGSVSQVMDLIDYVNSKGVEGYYGLPVINLKYYSSDNLEWRLGFQFAARTKNDKTITPIFDMDGDLDDEEIAKSYKGSNYTRFLPGVAYHFSSSNLLDVYLGAQLPIGFNSETEKLVVDDGDYEDYCHKGSFVVGAGIFAGLQLFIADLPIAVGLELGYSGQLVAEGVPSYRHKTEDVDQKYKMGTRSVRANWGADAAITFSYYFH